METNKNLLSEKQLPPEIVPLKELYRLNVIYAMFILHGNRTATSKALDISVRGLRDNLREIESLHKVQFPAGGIAYRTDYLKYNFKGKIDEKFFITQHNPDQKIEKLKVFVSQFGFPYTESQLTQ